MSISRRSSFSFSPKFSPLIIDQSLSPDQNPSTQFSQSKKLRKLCNLLSSRSPPGISLFSFFFFSVSSLYSHYNMIISAFSHFNCFLILFWAINSLFFFKLRGLRIWLSSLVHSSFSVPILTCLRFVLGLIVLGNGCKQMCLFKYQNWMHVLFEWNYFTIVIYFLY